MQSTKETAAATRLARHTSIALTLALTLLAGSVAYGQVAIQVTNHGIAGDLYWSSLNDDILVFPASEVYNHTDLDGDGEIRSNVLHIVDLASGSMTNLGIGNRGTVFPLVFGDLLTFLLREDTLVPTDWNGDSDSNDWVPWVYRISDGSSEILPYAIRGAWPGDEFMAMTVREQQHGMDLNDDSDLDDDIALTYDAQTGLVHNHMLSVFRLVEMGVTRALYYVEEDESGVDLNGDGDAQDRVAHLYESNTGSIRNLGIAVLGGRFYKDLLVLTVSEEGEQTDLNGDGDTVDEVLHVLEPGEHQLRNLGLATILWEVTDTMLAAGISESRQGADLNSDGDLLDHVLHIYDRRTGEVVNVGILGGGSGVAGNFVAYPLPEYAYGGGTDLNGDGDTADHIMHVYNYATGELINLGLSPSTWYSVDEKIVAFRVQESAEGADFDGDGAFDHDVLHVFDLESGELTNLGIDVLGGFRHGLGRVAFLVDETRVGRDLNGNHRIRDEVVHVYDGEKVVNLGLQGEEIQFDGTTLAFLVQENMQGSVDLNGDGLVNVATVLHTASFVQLDPEVLIEELIIDVRELIDTGVIRYGRGRSLIAELQVALWFLQFNNGESIAAVRLELFIIKVERMIDTGEVDPALGNELLTKARTILELLRN